MSDKFNIILTTKFKKDLKAYSHKQDNLDELEEKSIYKKSLHLKPRTEILKIYFNEGKIFFNDVVTKKAIYEVIKSI